MKKKVRYQVRYFGSFVMDTDNICVAWETKDKYQNYGNYITIHEITTIEKDITETAKGNTKQQ